MTDHADIVREALICPEHKMRDCSPLLNGCSKVNALHAALDALVAERDDARRDYESQREYADEQYRKALAAEAEVARLREAREALTKILYVSENNQEMSIIARFDAIHAAARAALGEKA